MEDDYMFLSPTKAGDVVISSTTGTTQSLFNVTTIPNNNTHPKENETRLVQLLQSNNMTQTVSSTLSHTNTTTTNEEPPPGLAKKRKRRRRRRQGPEKKNPAELGLSPTPRYPFLNATNLLQSGHFSRLAASIARAYPGKSPDVCSIYPLIVKSFNSQQVYKVPIQGLFYNKVPKAASSTLAGVNRRVALHWGYRLHSRGGSNRSNISLGSLYLQNQEAVARACTHKESHVVGAGRFYGNRLVDRSFLWGSIRDPASRALSRIFFFQISQAGRSDDDETILRFLKGSYNPQTGVLSKGRGGFQLQYLTLNAMDEWTAWSKNFPTLVQRDDLVVEQVQNVTQQYDFLALTERMDESIVAMQLLLGLNVGDVLSSSSKVGGAFYYRGKDMGCIPIQKTHRSPAVQEYLQSDEWQAVNYGDYLLYATANRSLDLTIDRLGKARFSKALQVYRHAMQIVKEQCADETFFPCSKNGTIQIDRSNSNCYLADEGCGFACIDRLVEEHGW